MCSVITGISKSLWLKPSIQQNRLQGFACVCAVMQCIKPNIVQEENRYGTDRFILTYLEGTIIALDIEDETFTIVDMFQSFVNCHGRMRVLKDEIRDRA